MKFIINSQIFEKFPEVLIGIIAVQGVNNAGRNPEIDQMLSKQQSETIDSIKDAVLVELPKIACWRDAYRKFGAKPKDSPPSIENLIRRIKAGHEVSHINKLVDLYNVISLKYMLPVGGEDIDCLKGDVQLTVATEGEEAVMLLGEREARPPHVGEVIYKDDLGTICRRWNWKEVDRSKLTKNTKNAFLVIEVLPPSDRSELTNALEELSKLVEKYCEGKTTFSVLDKDNPSFELK